MKKLNYLLLGLAGLTLASCSQEDVVAPGTGDGNFSITVKLPADMGTRALGDGLAANTLVYAVYDVTNVTDENPSPIFSFQGEASFNNSLETTLNLNLITGKKYQLAFFACSPDALTNGDNVSVYTFNPEITEEDPTPAITVNYDKMLGSANNADAYDCFYKMTGTYEVGKSQSPYEVILTRPVAQINWGTSELGENNEIDVTFGKTGQYIQTNLVVSGVYTKFDLFNGNVVDGSETDVTLFAVPNQAQIPTGTPFPVDPTTYDYVACQYVLAPVGGSTCDLTLNIQNGANGGNDDQDIAIAVNSAPIQANYRTNIYGNLLSTNATFQITKDKIFTAQNSSNLNSGATVEITEDGTVECITPILPAKVTEEDLESANAGGVYIDSNGEPAYFEPTAKGIQSAINNGATEIYLTPNSRINNSNRFTVPEGNLTIHGNGATLYGSNYEVALAGKYSDGSTINLDIRNLNNVKVWNAPEGDFTLNLYMTNCTMTGTGLTDGTNSLTNMRRTTNLTGRINIYLDNCYVQNTQLGVYSVYPGTFVFNNCRFNKVGIPYNINKKSTEEAEVTITGNVFNTCGISPEDTTNGAYNYAAPIRVITDAGPEYSISVLVDNCVFINTQSEWDILLMDYRPGEVWYPVKYEIENCTPANPSVKANAN